MDKQECMLVEYQALREEIIADKGNRMNVLGFTIAGIGAAMAFVLGLESSALETYNNFSFGLIAYALVMILIALILTANLTKSIARIGTYIKHNIEPYVDGLGWENQWQNTEGKRRKVFVHAAKGQSRAYAAYYLILATGTVLVALTVELYKAPLHMFIVLILYLICLLYGLNLWLRVVGFKSV